VLVVDDDPSTRLMVREVLSPAGFLVEEADGGWKGLRLAESFRPDVILLDILMPEMNGFETLKLLRVQHHGSSCPVVMITGLQDPGSVESAFELGASDFVTKPINWGLLRLRLNYALRSSAATRSAGRDPLETALRLAGVGTWDWDPRTDRLVVSDSFLDLLGMRRRPSLSSRFALARIHRGDRRRVLGILRQAVAGGEPDLLDLSFRVLAREGEKRVVRLRATATGDDGTGLTGILEDVSEKEALVRKLETLKSGAGRIQHLIRDLVDPLNDEEVEANR